MCKLLSVKAQICIENICKVTIESITRHQCMCCTELPCTCGVCGRSLSYKDILNDLLHKSQVGLCVCTSYKGNSFVAVVVVFHVAIKLPQFSNDADVSSTFEVAFLPSPPYFLSTLWGRMGKLKAIDNTTSTSNVHIFQFNSYRNYLSDAPEFYLVCPDHWFFCFLPLLHLVHPLLFFFVVLIDTSATFQLLSLSAIQKQLETMQHVIPEP